MFRTGEREHLVIENEILQDDQSGTEESHTVTKRCRRRGRHGRRKGSRAALSTTSTSAPDSASQDSDDSPPMSVLELFGLAVGTGKSPSGPAHRSVVTWNDLGKAKVPPQHDENTKIDRNSCGNEGIMFAQGIQSPSYGHNHFNGGFVRMPPTPLNSVNCSVSQWSGLHTSVMQHTEHPCGNNGYWPIHTSDWAIHQPVQHMPEVFREPNSVPHFSFPVKAAPDVQAEHPDALVEWVNKWGVCSQSPSSRTGLEEMLRASAPTAYED